MSVLTQKCVHFREERQHNRDFAWFRWTKYCARNSLTNLLIPSFF